ncbi:MAG: hypothetical protein U0359_35510 [Byssovorax sp.]
MAERGAVGEARAAESVASRFTRIMNATTSPIGVLSDPPIIAVCTAPLLIAFLAALRLEASPTVVQGLAALAALPTALGLVVSLLLLGARGRVVAWMGGLPFPIENMNALLNGLGDGLELAFEGACPSSAELNKALDQVSAESFVTRAPDSPGASPAQGEAPAGSSQIEIRIGVVDSKRNPAASNHERYLRVRALVDRVLVPLHARFPLAEVRVK